LRGEGHKKDRIQHSFVFRGERLIMIIMIVLLNDKGIKKIEFSIHLYVDEKD